MNKERKNQLAAMLTAETLEYFYNTLRGLYIDICNPDFWVDGEATLGPAIDEIISLLLTAEVTPDPPILLKAQIPFDQAWKEKWDIVNAIAAFRNGPKDNISSYLSSLQWLSRFAPSDVKKLINKCCENAGEGGIELHHTFEIEKKAYKDL